MGRVLAIDYGTKRIGVAASDPLQIIGAPLTTIETPHFFSFLEKYLQDEVVDKMLIGYPLDSNGKPTDATPHVDRFIAACKKKFPSLELEMRDEAFTSKMAVKHMVDSGMKKKDRRNKGMIDQMSAAIILQEYLQNL